MSFSLFFHFILTKYLFISGKTDAAGFKRYVTGGGLFAKQWGMPPEDGFDSVQQEMKKYRQQCVFSKSEGRTCMAKRKVLAVLLSMTLAAEMPLAVMASEEDISYEEEASGSVEAGEETDVLEAASGEEDASGEETISLETGDEETESNEEPSQEGAETESQDEGASAEAASEAGNGETATEEAESVEMSSTDETEDVEVSSAEETEDVETAVSEEESLILDEVLDETDLVDETLTGDSTNLLNADGSYSINLDGPSSIDGYVTVSEADGVKTIAITANGSYTLTGTAANTCISVAGGVEATITLYGAVINGSNYDGEGIEAVLACGEGAKVSLVLEGTNRLLCNKANEAMENAILGSKSGSLTISGSGTLAISDTADDAIKFKKGTVNIEGGSVSISDCYGDGIKAENANIKAGTLSITDCYGDGVQAENIDISGGSTTIETVYETASTQYYTSGTSSVTNMNTIWESGDSKYERVNVDVGSHKALKGGTKASTTYIKGTSEAEDSEEASGGITISGGTVEVDTTAAGVKANKATGYTATSSGVYIIGSPDDGIHSNNTLSITGGIIEVAASDDGITAGSTLSITGTPTINITDSYEGMEGGTIIIGESGSSTGPNISIDANDDGINASSKTVTYTYDSEDDLENDINYVKMSTSQDGNTCTIYSGKVQVEIDSENEKSRTLNGTTIKYTASGDGIDCNGSLDIEGGKVFVFGQSTGDNTPIDVDDSFTLAKEAKVLAAGAAGQGDGSLPSKGAGAYITYTGTGNTATAKTPGSSSTNLLNADVLDEGPGENGMAGPGGSMAGGPEGGTAGGPGGNESATIAAGTVFTVSDSTSTLISKKLPYAAGFVLYASPNMTAGSTYSISTSGTEVSSLDTEETETDSGSGTSSDSGSGTSSDSGSSTSTAVSIAKATITGISSKTYTGSKITQSAKVVVNGTTLKEGTHYTVSYSNNVNAGTATMKITGKGSYTGTVTKTFKITAKSVTPAVTLSTRTFIYNGKVREPAVTVKVGGQKLAASNYSVAYSSGHKNVGSYTATVTLKNNYSGKNTAAYVIKPKGTALKSLKGGTRSFTAIWNKQAAQTTGYQIQYSRNKKFTSSSTARIKKSSVTKRVVKKLTSGKAYYVRIRCYKTVGKKTYYSNWSKTATVKTQ